MFKEINYEELNENLGNRLEKEWALVTAGEENNFNTMTISWSSFGTLWHKKMATIYIGSTRYTNKYLEKENYFTISFFDKKYKKELSFCGTKSGKDIDKIKETGFTKEFDKAPYFKEASLVLICKKVAKTDMTNTNIYDKEIKERVCKEDNGFYYMYNGIIEKVLINESDVYE